nr:uncharacterized protein LOC112927897 [Vulpes vulpes]
MRTTSVVKQESTANTDILPHHLGPAGIRPKTTPKAIVTTVPMVVAEELTLDNSVVYALVILTLGVIVLVLCCFYCCLRVPISSQVITGNWTPCVTLFSAAIRCRCCGVSPGARSGSVDNNWMDIYNLVEDLVNKFENPNVRISFVTYSTDGHTLLKLTSDKNKIRDGLAELQNIVPTGATHMQEGFIKVNEQIEEVNSGDKKFPSMIIALTDGTLMPEPYEETKIEAERSRQLGATIYSIGVMDYRRDQLLSIADSPDHVFGVDNGFKGLQDIVEPLTAKSCIEITNLEPSTFCAGRKSCSHKPRGCGARGACEACRTCACGACEACCACKACCAWGRAVRDVCVRGVPCVQGVWCAQAVWRVLHMWRVMCVLRVWGVLRVQGVQGVRCVRGVLRVRGVRGVRGVQGVRGVRGVLRVRGARGVQGVLCVRGVLSVVCSPSALTAQLRVSRSDLEAVAALRPLTPRRLSPGRTPDPDPRKDALGSAASESVSAPRSPGPAVSAPREPGRAPRPPGRIQPAVRTASAVAPGRLPERSPPASEASERPSHYLLGSSGSRTESSWECLWRHKALRPAALQGPAAVQPGESPSEGGVNCGDVLGLLGAAAKKTHPVWTRVLIHRHPSVPPGGPVLCELRILSLTSPRGLIVAFTENYELMVSGRGFNNARNPEEVICRFIFTDKKFFDKKAITMDDTTVMCPGVTIDNPDEVVLVEVSLNNGINFIKSNANITSKNCVTARDVPVEVPTVIPPIPTPHIDLPTPPATSNMPNVNPLCLALLLLALLLLPFLIWCCWRHCCKKPSLRARVRAPCWAPKTGLRLPLAGPPGAHRLVSALLLCPGSLRLRAVQRLGRDPQAQGGRGLPGAPAVPPAAEQGSCVTWSRPRTPPARAPVSLTFQPCKELPAVQIIQREPMGRCVPPPCPTFIVPCACQGGGMRRIEGKLDTLCDFVQCCNQMPLLWCQPRSKRRCFNFSLQPCRRLPCGPRICLPAPQECFPLSSCCSRYQPAPRVCSRLPSRMLPPPRALCGTALSLPPP